MAAPFRTYLDLTNTIIRELNEVELTTASFASSAKGIQKLVKKGDKISKDQPLVNIESMKMENTIKSDKEGIVKQINFKIGDTINSKDPIINLS